MEKETKKEKNIHDLELHEGLEIKSDFGGKIEIIKVPGGWIYSFEYPGWRQNQNTFVPFVPLSKPPEVILGPNNNK